VEYRVSLFQDLGGIPDLKAYKDCREFVDPSDIPGARVNQLPDQPDHLVRQEMEVEMAQRVLQARRDRRVRPEVEALDQETETRVLRVQHPL
jgi:hypothetical protein